MKMPTTLNLLLPSISSMEEVPAGRRASGLETPINNLLSAMMQNQNPEILLRNARENLAVDEGDPRLGPFVLDQAAASSSSSSSLSLSRRSHHHG